MKNCLGCIRKHSLCPIPGYKKDCPCRDCLIKPMCIVDCERFKILRSQNFKDFLDVIVKFEKGMIKYEKEKGLTKSSWITYEEAVWEKDNG